MLFMVNSNVIVRFNATIFYNPQRFKRCVPSDGMAAIERSTMLNESILSYIIAAQHAIRLGPGSIHANFTKSKITWAEKHNPYHSILYFTNFHLWSPSADCKCPTSQICYGR